MKKNIFLLSSFLTLLCACSSDDTKESFAQIDEFYIISPSYEYADTETRTDLSDDGENSIIFSWDSNEKIGVFPVSPMTNSQVSQVFANTTGGVLSKVSFDGVGWALKAGNTYAAYYPWQDLYSSTRYNAVPYDYTGQVQDGNASLAHIGESYDYMYAYETVPSNGVATLAFNHLGAIIRVKLYMPAGTVPTSVTFANAANEQVFNVKGNFNASNGELTATETASSITLTTKNIATTEDNTLVVVYMSVLPCTTGVMTVTVQTEGGETLSGFLSSKTLVAGKAYRWVTTVS
ncbi:MAG: fimbrillin family protein [Bacteroidaceae bacterium]|nr:fimbrillin family protein [Bacteroidaceae bacterium]